jgi:hypothetical protein
MSDQESGNPRPLNALSTESSPNFWREWNRKLHPWPRTALCVVFVVLWAAASGSAWYTCGDLCSTKNQPTNVFYAYLQCYCNGEQYKHVEYTEVESGRYQATQAFDILLL